MNARARTAISLLYVAALALAGCARLPVTAKLRTYQGAELADVTGLRFDGKAFVVPGEAPIARQEVQVVEWHVRDKRGDEWREAASATGLSELAQEMLERGRAMAEAHPGVAGVVLVDDGEFVYRKDGTNGYRYHFAGLVLKEEMKAWAQIALGFTEGRSRTGILYARSVSPDGAVQTLSPDALEVGSPSEEMQFFNPNRKVASGVIPGVEVGSIVEYAYEYERYDPEDPRLFFPGYFFQGEDPVVFSRVKVTVPKSVPFNYVTRNFGEGQIEGPVIDEGRGNRTYTWLVEDSPPLQSEPYMPPQQDLVPMMDGSVFASFEDAYALQRDLQVPRMVLTPAIEAAVEAITEGAATTEGKLAAIYHWVQANTRYISIKGSLGAGWSGHTAQETFDNRYGDCTDKAVLFATMCKAIGVTSYPIILRTNDSGVGVTEIPTMDGNHAISEVVLDGGSIYLDTTAQNYRYPYFRADDHGAMAFNAIRGDIKPIPVPPPEDNQRYSHLDVTLEPSGDVLVKTRNEYNGNIEAGIRGFWKQTREDNRAARMADYVNSLSPGAVLEDFTLYNLEDVDKQLSMNIDYTLKRHAIRAKDLMYMRMPTLECDYPEAALETRSYPIQYRTSEKRILEIDVSLPKGFRPKWLPPPLDIENRYVEYHAAYEEHDGGIRFRQVFRRPARIVPPEDYPEYRDALRAIAAFSKKEVFLTVRD